MKWARFLTETWWEIITPNVTCYNERYPGTYTLKSAPVCFWFTNIRSQSIILKRIIDSQNSGSFVSEEKNWTLKHIIFHTKQCQCYSAWTFILYLYIALWTVVGPKFTIYHIEPLLWEGLLRAAVFIPNQQLLSARPVMYLCYSGSQILSW